MKGSLQLLAGDCRAMLATLAPESVHCVVTSPPYYGLRDYKIPATVWGGDPACEHDFSVEFVATEVGKGNWAQGVNGRGEAQPGGADAKREPIRARAQRGTCRHCGAWRGCLGLEPTPQLFIANMVEVFRAVHRVLRKDGTLWLNIGDTYAGSGRGGATGNSGLEGSQDAQNESKVASAAQNRNRLEVSDQQRIQATTRIGARGGDGVKLKDLIGIPWMLAFALRDDGWYLRQDIIWNKTNPMPESAPDRCCRSHEYVFLLSKSRRYYFDEDAIAEPAAYAHEAKYDNGESGLGTDGSNAGKGSSTRKFRGKGIGGWGHGESSHHPEHQDRGYSTPSHAQAVKEASANGTKPPPGAAIVRKKRSVWTVTTYPFPGAHLATFPPKLIEPCILAGTSAHGCCATCGAPWARITEKDLVPGKRAAKTNAIDERDRTADVNDQGSNRRKDGHKAGVVTALQTIGWKPTCKHSIYAPRVPCTVLDPFGGAGTTALVANRAHRRAILIDISAAYLEMARARIEAEAPLLTAEAIA